PAAVGSAVVFDEAAPRAAADGSPRAAASPDAGFLSAAERRCENEGHQPQEPAVLHAHNLSVNQTRGTPHPSYSVALGAYIRPTEESGLIIEYIRYEIAADEAEAFIDAYRAAAKD